MYIHFNGAKYEGNWKNDMQDGLGKETWPDGSTFEGQYRLGRKEGSGNYIWKDGSIY